MRFLDSHVWEIKDGKIDKIKVNDTIFSVDVFKEGVVDDTYISKGVRIHEMVNGVITKIKFGESVFTITDYSQDVESLLMYLEQFSQIFDYTHDDKVFEKEEEIKKQSKVVKNYNYTKIDEFFRHPIHKEVLDKINDKLHDGFTIKDMDVIISKMYPDYKQKTIRMKSNTYVSYLRSREQLYSVGKDGLPLIYYFTGGDKLMGYLRCMDIKDTKMKKSLTND